MRIEWSDHAISRARERFGSVAATRIPARGVRSLAAAMDNGDELSVRQPATGAVLVKRRLLFTNIYMFL